MHRWNVIELCRDWSDVRMAVATGILLVEVGESHVVADVVAMSVWSVDRPQKV